MTNYEKLSEEDKKNYISKAYGVDKNTGCLVECAHLRGCFNCLFSGKSMCFQHTLDWLNTEAKQVVYQIPQDTPVNTKVEVSDDGVNWVNRYFAGKFDIQGRAYSWSDGRTSWTRQSDYDMCVFKYCRPIEWIEK